MRTGIFGILTCVALGSLGLAASPACCAADIYTAAVQHAGRSPEDLERDKLEHPADILRVSGIKPGMQVIDVLAGGGYYSELLSYVVGPKGHVLLLNNAAYDHWSTDSGGWQKRLADNRLPNVEHHTADLEHLDLPDHSADALILIKVYHDLYWVDPKPNAIWPKMNTSAVLDQLARVLKPGGILLIEDHSAKPGTGSADASRLHRIDEAYTVKDFEKRGFKPVGKNDVLRRPDDQRTLLSYEPPGLGKTDRFVLVFRKE